MTLDKKNTPPASSKKNLITQSPVFYGWVILAAGTFGIIMTSPGQTYTVSIFIEYMIDDLGISRSAISSLYSVSTLIGSFALPFWGRQIDRRGARQMIVLISILFGLACIYMGFVQNALMLGLGFVLIRMLGQGSLSMVSQTVINQWWIRKRGMVSGISGVVMALLGMGAFPTLVYALISRYEWRHAYGILGFALLLLMAPIGYLFVRNRPEDYQLSPDGAKVADPLDTSPLARSISEEESWTLHEAMQTYTFWILILGLASFALISTGLFFHLVSIFDDHGLSPAIAASVFVPVSLAAAIANLAGGFLTDHLPSRYLLMLGLLIQAVSLIMAQFLQGAVTVILFGVLLGATNGIARVLGAVAWPSYFGRQNLGSIYGFTIAAGVVGAAIGPLPFGIARDILGSYQPALYASAVVCILLAILGFSMKKPIRHEYKFR